MPEASSAAAGPQPLDLPAGRSYLCSCGRSRQGWFCDGAHLGSGLIAREVQLEEPGTVLKCGCGRSEQSCFEYGLHEGPPVDLLTRSRGWIELNILPVRERMVPPLPAHGAFSTQKVTAVNK